MTYFMMMGTGIFVDKSVIHVDAFYIKYFMDLEMIHEYICGLLWTSDAKKCM